MILGARKSVMLLAMSAMAFFLFSINFCGTESGDPKDEWRKVVTAGALVGTQVGLKQGLALWLTMGTVAAAVITKRELAAGNKVSVSAAAEVLLLGGVLGVGGCALYGQTVGGIVGLLEDKVETAQEKTPWTVTGSNIGLFAVLFAALATGEGSNVETFSFLGSLFGGVAGYKLASKSSASKIILEPKSPE